MVDRTRSAIARNLCRGAAVILAIAMFASCGDSRGVSAGGTAGGKGTGTAAMKAEIDTVLSEGPITYYKAAAFDAPVPSAAVPVTTKAGGGGTFVISDSGPVGVLPAEVGRPTIHVVFSRPVVALSALGEVMRTSAVMKIEPRLRGVFRWYGTRMLAFESEEEAIPQRNYTVNIDGKLTSLDGSSLAGPLSFSFHTEYLAMESVIPGDVSDATPMQDEYGSYYSYSDPEQELSDVPIAKAADFLIKFTYPVEPATVAKSIAIDSGGKAVAFECSRPPQKKGFQYDGGIERHVRIRLSEKPAGDADITITLGSGARSDPASLPTEKASSLKFHTILPFAWKEYDTDAWEFYDSVVPDKRPVFLRFSHPVKKESVAGAIACDPHVVIKPENIEVKGDLVRLNDLGLAYDASYTFTLGAGISDTYGRTLGKPVAVTVKTASDSAYVIFPDQGTRMLEAAYQPRIAWELKNMVSGAMKVAPISDPFARIPVSDLVPFDTSKIPPHTSHYGIIDLKPMLNGEGKGFAGIGWSFKPAGKNQKARTGNLQVQVTDLGITVRYGYNRLVGVVTQLSTGKPVPDATVSLMKTRDTKRIGRTDAKGLIVFGFASGEYRDSFIDFIPETRDRLRIRVEKGSDRIEFEPDQSHNMYSGGIEAYEGIEDIEKPRQVAFLFSDRKIYRPGERVSFRGIDRDLRLGAYEAYTGPCAISLMPPEWDGAPLETIHGSTTELGGFYGSFALPEGADPGEYSILYERGELSSRELRSGGATARRRYYSGGGEVREWIEVAYFKKQLYSVSLDPPAGTRTAGDSLSMNFAAEYLSGGTLASAKWDAYWTRESTQFDFGEKWRGYAFGPDPEYSRSTLGESTGTLSSEGKGETSLATSSADFEGAPYLYTFNLNVSDAASGRLSGSSRGVFVHPAAFAIGLKLRDSAGPWFVVGRKDTDMSFDFVLVDAEGKEFTRGGGQKVSVDIVRVEWKVAQQKGVNDSVNTRYERVETPVRSETLTVRGNSGSFVFRPDKAGAYAAKAVSQDQGKRAAVTRLSFYVTGSGQVRWNSADSDAITLTPDRQTYSPGDTAKLLVRSPLPAGRYLLTMEREGIFEEKIIELEGSTSTIDIPVKPEYLPIVYVALSSHTVRSKEPSTAWRVPDLDKPKGLFGIAALVVDSTDRRIALEISPDKTVYRPGSEASVVITARDSSGKPVAGAEISFMAADRGVLDLVDYHVPDPHAWFYAPYHFPIATSGADSRSLLLDPVTYQVKDLQGGAGDDSKGGERSDFRSTAVFKPFLKTDAQGRVVAKFMWPDSLTTWRCTAVAAGDDKFGLAESEVSVRNPINVKALMPGRLRLRDTMYGGLMITNLETSDRTVSVTCSSDILTLPSGAKASVTVKPGETSRIEFRLAAVRAGEGEVVYSVSADSFSEKLVERVTVESPRVEETVTLMGSTKDSESEGLVIPTSPEGSGSLDLKLASSGIPALGNAFSYLFRYPYGCLEQTISSLMPMVLFGDYIEAFGIDTEVVDPRATVAAGIMQAAKSQLQGGGFPYWPDGDRMNLYVSVRMAHLLHEAEAAGYAIPGSLDVGALLSAIADSASETASNDYLAGYAAYVMALYGFNVAERVGALLDKGYGAGIRTMAFAALADFAMGDLEGADRILTGLGNYLRPNLRGVDLTDPGKPGAGWYSGGRSDIESLSFLLLLWQSLRPGDDMTVRLANAIVSRQRGGYWHSTAETVWALRALAAVARAEDSGKGVMKASVILDGTALLEAGLYGVGGGGAGLMEKTVKLDFRQVPLDTVKRDALLPLVFAKEGAGKLHYTASMRYAIPNELAGSRDEGIGVYAEFLSSDGKKPDQSRMVPGGLYRMRVVISSAKDLDFVAVRIPVPSGCEILDSRMVTAGRVATVEDPSADDEPRAWIPQSRQSIYDNEVRYFFDAFPKGRQIMEFAFRAFANGVYPVPPAVAECMYEPEIFGRGRGGLVVIGEERKK